MTEETKKRESISRDAFFERIRLGRQRTELVEGVESWSSELADLDVEDGNAFLIDSAELKLDVLVLRNCTLPRLHLRGKLDVLTLDMVKAKEVRIACSSDPLIILRWMTLESLEIQNSTTLLEIGGTIGHVTVYGTPKTLVFNQLHAQRMHMCCSPAAVQGRPEGNGERPLIVSEIVRTHHPTWTKFFALACPEAPIFFSGDLNVLNARG